jgi:hypothetical protein
MSIKVGDRVWCYRIETGLLGEPGTVLESKPTEWGTRQVKIALDSRPDRPVYLFPGAVWGFDPILPGACPACNGSPGRVHNYCCPRYPCRRSGDERIVGRESDGPPSYCVAPPPPPDGGRPT